jgi:hypothetical protein
MSWRLNRPRRISAYEKQILRRLLEVGGNSKSSPALLASIDTLMVREEGDGDFHNDSLDFGRGRVHNDIVASGIGLMANDSPVELILWARDNAVTYLELEPFDGTLRPIRMPRLESITTYPDSVGDEEEEDEEADDLAS